MRQSTKEEMIQGAVKSNILGPGLLILGIAYFVFEEQSFLLYLAIPAIIIGGLLTFIRIALLFKKENKNEEEYIEIKPEEKKEQ